MELARYRLPVSVKSSTERKLRGSLRKSYPFVIDRARGILRDSLKLESFEDIEEVSGEIYCTDRGTLFYYYIPEEKNCIEAGCIAREEESEKLFQQFRSSITRLFSPQSGEDELKWCACTPMNASFTMLKDEAWHLEPSAQDLTAVSVLQDENARLMLRDIEQISSSSMDNLLRDRTAAELEFQVEKLMSVGLVHREFTVFCRDNNVQISRVPTLSAIEEASSKGLKCPFCERLFSDERIDQSLTCTPFGAKMTRPNLWLVYHVLQILASFGISTTDILVKEEKNARFFDILVNHQNSLIFIEVKDTPSKLNEFFLFESRIRFYKPDVAIFLTTTPINNEINLLISRKRETPLIVIEGLETVRETLQALLLHKQGTYLKEVFSLFKPLTEVNMGKMFSGYFIDPELQALRTALGEPHQAPPEETFTAEAPDEEILPAPEAEDVVKAEEITGGFAEAEEEGREEEPPAEEMAEEIPEEEEIEEESLLIEEIIPTGSVTFATLEDDSARDLLDDNYEEFEEDRLEDITEGTSLEETVMEDDMTGDEFREGEEPALAAETAGIAGTADSDMGDEFMPEENLTSNFSSAMDTASEISQEEHQKDEARESCIRSILDSIAVEGLAGRSEDVSAMLKDLNGINNYRSLLADSEGLPVLDEGEGGQNAEALAPLITEISGIVKSSLIDTGFPAPNSIHINRKNSCLYIYPVAECNLAVFEAVSARDSEEETGQLPGEIELREIIMKKVLEDLSKEEDVIGNVVASMDGLSIDSMFNDERDIDLISSVCSQIISDNQKYIAQIGEEELKQLVIFTEDTIYSLIPLNSEGILISMFYATAPKESWKTHLAGPAMMIASVFQ